MTVDLKTLSDNQILRDILQISTPWPWSALGTAAASPFPITSIICSPILSPHSHILASLISSSYSFFPIRIFCTFLSFLSFPSLFVPTFPSVRCSIFRFCPRFSLLSFSSPSHILACFPHESPSFCVSHSPLRFCFIYFCRAVQTDSYRQHGNMSNQQQATSPSFSQSEFISLISIRTVSFSPPTPSVRGRLRSGTPIARERVWNVSGNSVTGAGANTSRRHKKFTLNVIIRQVLQSQS